MARSSLRSHRTWWYSGSIAIVTLLGIMTGVAWYSMRKLIYPIDESIEGTPRSQIAKSIRQGLVHEYGAVPISFRTDDGLRLSGLYLASKQSQANILLCHGYHHDKEGLHAIIDHFGDRYSYFLFDFRGHGQSEYALTTIGHREQYDVVAAMNEFKRLASSDGNAERPFYIIGFSMGAAAALGALAKQLTMCDGIVADSAYADLRDEIAHVFSCKSGLPNVPFLYLMRLFSRYAVGESFDGVRPVDYVQNVPVPMLFVHSCADRITKPSDALELYESARRAKRTAKLWITPPCAHASLFIEEPHLYKKKVEKFLRSS